VSFDEQMAAVEDGPTEVVVRAVDSEDEEHVRSVTVEPGSRVDASSASNGESGDAGETDGDAGSERTDATDESSGGDSANNGGGGDDGGEATSTPTVIPGFGPGHALVAVVSAALLLARRRSR
jgi:PGF-CTERM protein